MTYCRMLNACRPHTERKKHSSSKLEKICEKFKESKNAFTGKEVCVFCAGSLARDDVGNMSDMDLFILSNENHTNRSKLKEVELIGKVIDINRALGYKDFSNDGEYLKVYSMEEMTKTLGAPKDDVENLFTTRMLLLLESKPVFNKKLYNKFIEETIDTYFRDSSGKKSFKPLFLLNDILRWWRTVCLNYEIARGESLRPWRKKNINLKFSRMLTVFGTVLPMISMPITNSREMKALMSWTPHQRFAKGLDYLKDGTMVHRYEQFLKNYERFLRWKEVARDNLEFEGEKYEEVRAVAEEFSKFIYDSLSHQNIDSEYKRYLIL